MGALYFLLVLAVSTTNVWAAQFFCVGVDCKNVTLYLGPRFGSKIIQLSPLQPNITFPTYTNSTSWKSGANSTADFWRNSGRTANNQKAFRRRTTTAAPSWRWAPSKMFGPEGSRVVYGTYRPFNKPSLDYGAPIGPLIPRVRPVLIDGSQAVDITGYDVTQDWYRPRGVHSAANSLSKGLLNLTGRGFSGEDVKKFLGNMTSTNLTSTTRLILNANLIKGLSSLTFPVELEYSLTELWMDDNPLRYLSRSTSTSFEITRLNNLKVLSLSNTSLTYLSSLYLPHLEVLYLKNNYLTEIPEGFNNLRQLHLTNNRIFSVTPSDLASYTNLRLLDLSNNMIDFIFDHGFMSLMSLKTLYLNNNSLTDVTDVDGPRDAMVFLSDNPLVCNCPLAELVNQAQVVDKLSVQCTDDNYRSFKSATSVGLAPCRDPWHWWKRVCEKIEPFFMWLYNMGVTWHNIRPFLYWALFITALYAVIKVIRSKNFKTKSSVVPYNILDDKNAFMDDCRPNSLDHRSEKPVREMIDKIAIINEENNS